ncbi:MAG: hypothetical protein ACK2UK_12960 [Candidatus Promineifilaceae bacterium]
MDELETTIDELEKQTPRRAASAEADLKALTISSLAHRCERATDRFFQGLPFDEACCLELFRRALEEKDDQAWGVILVRYDGLVRSWIHRHPSSSVADEDQDYFLNRTFDKFWYAFKRDARKFGRFATLSALLQYLKLCAYTAVQEYVERQMRPYDLPISELPVEALSARSEGITGLNDRLAARSLWAYIEATLKTEQERIVAEGFLLYDMKPREVYQQYAQNFDSVDQVRRVKGNLMARLRRDQTLLELLQAFD